MKIRDDIDIGGDLHLHISSAAKVLRYSRVNIRLACRQENLDCKKVGGAWYVSKTSLRAFLKEIQARRTKRSEEIFNERLKEKLNFKNK